jgi:hypothetical protein
MPRLPHHSSNYGGARPNSGRPKGSINKLTQDVIQKAMDAPVHPVDLLLRMVADKDLPMKERGNAAQALLPYVATRLTAAEINVTNELADKSPEELASRLLSINGQLQELGINIIDGESRRIVNGSGQTDD